MNLKNNDSHMILLSAFVDDLRLPGRRSFPQLEEEAREWKNTKDEKQAEEKD